MPPIRRRGRPGASVRLPPSPDHRRARTPGPTAGRPAAAAPGGAGRAGDPSAPALAPAPPARAAAARAERRFVLGTPTQRRDLLELLAEVPVLLRRDGAEAPLLALVLQLQAQAIAQLDTGLHPLLAAHLAACAEAHRRAYPGRASAYYFWMHDGDAFLRRASLAPPPPGAPPLLPLPLQPLANLWPAAPAQLTAAHKAALVDAMAAIGDMLQQGPHPNLADHARLQATAEALMLGAPVARRAALPLLRYLHLYTPPAAGEEAQAARDFLRELGIRHEALSAVGERLRDWADSGGTDVLAAGLGWDEARLLHAGAYNPAALLYHGPLPEALTPAEATAAFAEDAADWPSWDDLAIDALPPDVLAGARCALTDRPMAEMVQPVTLRNGDACCVLEFAALTRLWRERGAMVHPAAREAVHWEQLHRLEGARDALH